MVSNPIKAIVKSGLLNFLWSKIIRRLLLFLVLKISIIFLNNHIESSNTVYCNSRIDPTLYIVYTMNS